MAASLDWLASLIDISTPLERSALVDPDRSLGIEWAVRNSLGTYAAGTVAGPNTRHAHGLLVASTAEGSRVLVGKIGEEIEVDDHDGGERFALGCDEYHDGTLHPTGFVHLEEMRMEAGRPVWRWRTREVELEKSIAVAVDRNATVIRYRLLGGASRALLRLTPFVTDRSANDRMYGQVDWRWLVEHRANGSVVRSGGAATPVGLFGWSEGSLGRTAARFVETGIWYWSFLHRVERRTDRDPLDDLYTPGLFVFELAPGESAYVLLTADPDDLVAPDMVEVASLFGRANTVDPISRSTASQASTIPPSLSLTPIGTP